MACLAEDEIKKKKALTLFDEEHAAFDGIITSADNGCPPDPTILNFKKVDARTNTWSSLFQHHTDRSRDLHRHIQPSRDLNHHIEFDEDNFFAAVQNWGNALVSYFIGNSPPIVEIKDCLSKAWRIKDLEIIPMAEGFFYYSNSTPMMLAKVFLMKVLGLSMDVL